MTRQGTNADRRGTLHAMTTTEPRPANTEPRSEQTDDGGFEALGLQPALVRALAGLGYEDPTAIQREATPPLLEGRDVLAEAPTGTGKTAAFALPAHQRTMDGTRDG